MQPGKMKAPNKPIDFTSMARIVEVDNRFPLQYYYRIADNLLRQASIYREENNILDLYLMLLRYTSLVTETIPRHRDYQVLASRQRISSKKKAVAVIDELESIKPEALRIVKELNNAYATTRQFQLDGPERNDFGLGTSSLDWSGTSAKTVSSHTPASSLALQSSWNYGNGHAQVSFPSASRIDNQLQKLSLSRPPPNKETLSRHSFLGPNGFSGWTAPSTEVKVQYPSSNELTLIEDSRLNQAGQCDNVSVDVAYSGGSISPMESVLSLDDGRWFRPAEEVGLSMANLGREHNFHLPSVRQPSPPPVLAEIKQEYCAIPPSKVADPRPGVAKASQDGISNSYQHLHIPVKMMDDFLRLARENTKKNLETCGVLAGSLKNRVFHITTLIIPKQEATSDSCQTLNEEEIYDVQEKLSLFPLGWIHTHPTQTCFMSSVDLHTHYSYQIMLPEAIAIVMAPTDSSSPHGIFHLSDPAGVTLIRNCQNRGFHPHEEPEDGSPIYEHCSHVYMNPKVKFEVMDLR